MNPSAPNAGANAEVLIAEDSPTQALLLQRILAKQGFRVTVAVHGRHALELLAASRPELVISDIQMPEMDGYELCRMIKSDPRNSDIPVILLTSLSAPQDIIRGLESGADNFIVKPYEEVFLMARIRTVLINREIKKLSDDVKGVEVEFSGQRYVIDSSRRQILNLLLSTYETAVQTNSDLIKAHEELKAAQAQLIEAEKLQSVGRLAAGVAHEVRNPLAIMEMGLEFMASQSSEDSQPILGEMREAVQRANGVISSLMDIASPNQMGMGDLDLHEIIERALGALEKGFDESGIEIVREFAAGLPSARMDGGKIEQVFVNIFTNALHAMPQGGTLTVKTEVKTLGRADVEFVAGDRSGVRFRDGDRAIVAQVADTGEGIALEHLGKVFDPFFSTKPTGKGMGLGLTVARKLVELHHGTIALHNGANGGAVVTLMFKV